MGFCHGQYLSKALCDILSMPASAVGVSNSFHYSDVLMTVAMRQFGISLLVVHDDDKEHDKRPYRTVNFLDILGSNNVFLPLLFGLIHIARDGSMGILRRRSFVHTTHQSKEPCYEGYALEMTKHIRMGGVNLLTGLFDLSYTAFAEYISKPTMGTQAKQKLKLPKVRDYQSASYSDLSILRKAWEDYQEFMQAQCRARERSPSTDNGGHETHTETSNAEHGHD